MSYSQKGSPEKTTVWEHFCSPRYFLCKYYLQGQFWVGDPEVKNVGLLSFEDLRTGHTYLDRVWYNVCQRSYWAAWRLHRVERNSAWKTGNCLQGHSVGVRPQRTVSHASQSVQRLFCQVESQSLMCTFVECISGVWGRQDRWHRFQFIEEIMFKEIGNLSSHGWTGVALGQESRSGSEFGSLWCYLVGVLPHSTPVKG